MNHNRIYIVALIFGIFMSACTVLSPTSSSTSGTYDEDLSAYRIDYSSSEEEEIEIDSSQLIQEEVEMSSAENIAGDLDILLDSIATLNRRKGYADGYSVQVYSGNSRESAARAKDRVYRIMPDAHPKMDYKVPNFLVRVGQYRSRLEAHKCFAQLKGSFPTAVVIPRRIYFKN